MKKTVIALSLAGLFSAGAMANSINIDIDNSVPHVPGNGIEIPVERPQPVDPDFGVKPDSNLPDRNGPNYTPQRPQPADPDFGVNPDSNVPDRDGPNYTPERPQPADPDFGVDVDSTPDRPEPADPDFGVDPTQPENPIVIDPEFGVTPTSERELIADLQQQMNERFAEMEEHMDGVRAGMHAITNARPFVTEGEFAIGAGVGFSGSKEALAIGGAYGFNEKISVSGTFHYETSGKVSGSEVAGGVGIQYKF